jgi:hypothetical protein
MGDRIVVGGHHQLLLLFSAASTVRHGAQARSRRPCTPPPQLPKLKSAFNYFETAEDETRPARHCLSGMRIRNGVVR